MNIIKNIIEDYESLINTTIKIPLDNGDIIKFSFKPQDLPHLLGLQYLVDNPVLFEYSQERLSATKLYDKMCSNGNDAVDTDKFEESAYFEDLYQNRIKYFSSERILDIIQARQIVKFNPEKITDFSTKLEKLEYMFWKRYKDEESNYGYFGIGFMASGKKSDINYPNTFFFRMDNIYICNQKVVLPMSFLKKGGDGNDCFIVYWEEVGKSMRNNRHYKKLKQNYLLENGRLDIASIHESGDEETIKHLILLQLDALDKAYLPYMKKDFRWSNDEKKYVIQRMKEREGNYFPYEIKMILNEYKQMRNI